MYSSVKQSYTLYSGHQVYKIGSTLSLVKFIGVQFMFGGSGRDGDEEGRVLGRVASDDLSLLIQLSHNISNPDGCVVYSA